MARKTTKTANLPAVLPKTYPIANVEIVPVQLFRVKDRHPKGDGPWQGEYEKIGWIDAATGLRCIILRQSDGTLSGYVGVERNHPLFGFEKDAVPDAFGLSVHGGITYASMCEANAPEEVSVCHIPARRHRPGTRGEFPDEEVWWFGFDANHDYDFIPQDNRGQPRETGQTYRDQNYVYRECMKLARQLDGLGDGNAGGVPLEIYQPTPPIGLEDDD